MRASDTRIHEEKDATVETMPSVMLMGDNSAETEHFALLLPVDRHFGG
jgi:hypothetical protein